MIYFIQSKCQIGFIKIGMARDIQERLKTLQTATAYELVVLRVLDGWRAEERVLHQRFNKSHRHNEWFFPTDDILAYVDATKTLCLGFDAEVEPPETDYAPRKDRLAHIRRRLAPVARIGGG